MATFAEFARWPAKTIVVLLELLPGYRLVTWTKTAGRTNVYQIAMPAFEAGGGKTPLYRPVTSVLENGLALSLQTSVATVDSTASAYFWDSAAGILYAHSSTAASPDTFASYMAVVTFRFADRGIVLNLTDGDPSTGVYYAPWLSGGYDTITQAMEDALTGILESETAQLELTNGHGFWHPVVANDGRYVWKNKVARILIGGSYNGLDLPYSQYTAWSTGLVDAISSNETIATLTLKPQTRATEQTLPVTLIDPFSYPNAGSGVTNTKKWIGYGRTVLTPDLVDTTGNGVWLLADALSQTLFAVNAVSAVDTSSGLQTTLVAGVDYTVNLTTCLLTVINPTYLWSSVSLSVDVTGKPDGLGSYLKTGPDIILDILTTFLAIPTSQIDLPSFAAAAAQAPQELAVWIKADRQIADVFSGQNAQLPSIGKSVMATVQQTLGGLWTCFIWKPGVDPATALSLRKEDLVTFDAQPRYGTVYGATRVYYAHDETQDVWKSVTHVDQKTQFEAQTTDTFEVYTFLRADADALVVAQRYQLISGAVSLEIEIAERGAILATARAGDKVLVTYSPAPLAAGQMTSYPMELIRVDRSLVPVLSMAGRLGDLRGIGARVGTWQNVGGAGIAYASASVVQQQAYGFWTDVNGYLVPGDETTRHKRIWW